MSSETSTAWAGPMPRVGDVAERSHVVGPDFIRLFTEISGDRNPLHYDEAAARASRFGEIVVQGGITSAILNAVVAEALPGPGTVFLHVDWRFTAPGPARRHHHRPGRGARGARRQADHDAGHAGDAPGRGGRARGQGRVLHDAARRRRSGRRGGPMTRRQ